VQQQVLDVDGPARRHQAEHRPVGIVFSFDADLHAGEGWNVLADGIVERDLAWSTSIIAAMLVMVLVTEWIGKMVSAVIGVPPRRHACRSF